MTTTKRLNPATTLAEKLAAAEQAIKSAGSCLDRQAGREVQQDLLYIRSLLAEGDPSPTTVARIELAFRHAYQVAKASQARSRKEAR